MIGDNDPTFYHYELINWRITRNDSYLKATDSLICISLDQMQHLFVNLLHEMKTANLQIVYINF